MYKPKKPTKPVKRDANIDVELGELLDYSSLVEKAEEIMDNYDLTADDLTVDCFRRDGMDLSFKSNEKVDAEYEEALKVYDTEFKKWRLWYYSDEQMKFREDYNKQETAIKKKLADTYEALETLKKTRTENTTNG